MREAGRMLLLAGLALAAVGAFIYFGWKLPFRLGRLPGDIAHRGEHSVFYFPIATSIVVSLGLTLLFWLFSLFRR